jgi:hypothetical protein
MNCIRLSGRKKASLRRNRPGSDDAYDCRVGRGPRTHGSRVARRRGPSTPSPRLLQRRLCDLQKPGLWRRGVHGNAQQKPDLHGGRRQRGPAALLGTLGTPVALFLALYPRLAACRQAVGLVLQSTPIVETALSQISETRDRLCITSTLATPKSYKLCYTLHRGVYDQPLHIREAAFMGGYLIYHPPRHKSVFGSVVVYHDHMGNHNQDPYIWNTQFLHTYCHITQMSPAVGHINFWVSGDTFPDFTHLYCDLVFVITAKVFWSEANTIAHDDPIVDNEESYSDHYRWGMYEHPFKRRRRYTLKADHERSFQPQYADHTLIDVVPFLTQMGLPLEKLRQGLRAGWQSKPYRIDAFAQQLYDWLYESASIHLAGTTLRG